MRLDEEHLQVLALLPLGIAIWAMAHSYLGVVHDSILYTLQALSRIHSDLYGNDVFLRYGSQDQYTVFPAIHATLIQLLGVEHGAAAITLISQALFYVAAWCLARTLLPPRLALLSLATLVIVPITYGALGIYHLVEDFASPRLLAEAVVLFAVLAYLRSRWYAAIALCLCATMLHPIMAFPGIAMLVWLQFFDNRPRRMFFCGVLAVLGLIIAAITVPQTSLWFDPAWLEIATAPAPYLMLSNWSLFDWTPAIVVLSVLAVGALSLEDGPARALSRASFVVAAAGITLAGVAGDYLRIAIVIQGQPWRWLWPATAFALLIFPALAQHLWSGGKVRQATLLLLLAAFFFYRDRYGIVMALLAVLCACISQRRIAAVPQSRMPSILLAGAGALAIVAAISSIADHLLTIAMARDDFFSSPIVAAGRYHLGNSVVAFVVVTVLWQFSRPRNTAWRLGMVAIGLALCIAIAPDCFRRWTRIIYSEQLLSAFSPWREMIPVGTDVLYVENPTAVWILLQRPSYISGAQTGTSLFSRQTAMVLKQRSDSIKTFLAHSRLSAWLAGSAEEKSLLGQALSTTELCNGTDIRFIVTRLKLPMKPAAQLSSSLPAPYKRLALYDCASYAGNGI